MASNTVGATSAARSFTFKNKIFTRIRLATESDVPHLHKLMHRIAMYHNLGHVFTGTEDSVLNNLFTSNTSRPFCSPAALILEVSSNPFPNITINPWFNPILKELKLDSPVADNEAEVFRSSHDHGSNIFVAGYIMFCPLYTAFFEKPGLYSDTMYFRECFRNLGLGRMLYSTVISYAARNGLSMVDGIVADWNRGPMELYTKMGGSIVKEFRLLKFFGEGLARHKEGPAFPAASSRL